MVATMTPREFRALALALPEVVEGEHRGHADFRVGGKVFATLGWPDASYAMLKLPPARQAICLRAYPAVFEAASGAWGRSGCTRLLLRHAKGKWLRPLLIHAWRQHAPTTLRHAFDAGPSVVVPREEPSP